MTAPPTAAQLGAELEAALLRELRHTYDDLNAAHFRRKLRRPSLELSDARGRLGRWVREARVLELSRALVLEHPWGVVVEVLKHEMAHQWVHEGLGELDESAHGRSFRAACERLGIDASATGLPTAGGAPGERDVRVLERIAKLLALAGSPNQHEAEAAMSAAHRLMLRHNLDAAAALEPRGYGYRHLGVATGRVGEADRILAVILDEHFFVEAIWVTVYRPVEGKRGRVLEVCGTQANLELAAYVHAFLRHTAEGLWREHRRARAIDSDRDRRAYLAGVMSGFCDKLESERSSHRAAGLVWVRDADLGGWFKKRHPYVQTTRHAGSRRTEAHAHGRAAGRAIVLHKGVAAPAGGVVRLLGK